MVRKLSGFFPEQSFMRKDEAIEQVIEAIADDFTFEELFDVSYMRQELAKLLEIEDHELVPILFGAFLLKTLRCGRQPPWKALGNMH